MIKQAALPIQQIPHVFENTMRVGSKVEGRFDTYVSLLLTEGTQ